MAMSKWIGRLAIALLVVLAASSAFAQNAGSLRGTITDQQGAVLPGAAVVLTNEATKAARQAVTDAKGGYFFAALLPGNYSIAVELSGFKGKTTRGIRISPNDTRGYDVTMEIGGQSEKIEVTAEREIIQTETGAREGVITASQIENLTIISRSPMELLRILPGVVAPDQSTMESVGNLTGANSTESYAVNGIRGHNIVITMDGSKLTDIGANNGAIVAPTNDFISEVKVQGSNYAAEFGSGGIQVASITKGGSSEFHGSVYDYLRHNKFAANDRSNSIAGIAKPKSKFQYPGATLSGPILIPGTGFNKNRDKAFFFFGVEFTRQQVDTGSSFAVTPTANQRKGDFNGYQGGQNLNQPTTVNIPSGFPGAGNPAPNNDLSPYIDPMGQKLINLYPLPNYKDPNNRYNYVFSTLQPQDRSSLVLRLDYNFSDSTKAYVRLAQDRESLEEARGIWWPSSNYELPTNVKAKNLGRSSSLNLTSVLSPTTTNEVLFSYSKLKLDNGHADESKITLAGLGIQGYQGFFGPQSTFAPIQLYSWGQNLGNLWDPTDQPNIFAYNASLQVSDNFTKVLNTHAIKFGVSVERATKYQNFQNNAQTALVFGPWIPGSTGSDFGDLLVGRPAEVDSGTKAANGDFRLWNLDAYLQDSWKIRKNFTLEYGVRLAKWTNNIETAGLGAVFIPSRYNPNAGTFLDADKKRVNGVAYASTGDVPKDLIGSRPVFVMPRLNFAWDIKGTGDMVLRGGGGLFYNRPMGNAEYDVIKVPPNAYGTSIDAYAGQNLGPVGLTYNTVPKVDPLNRIGKIGLASVNPFSVEYPRTTTTSLSFAKRVPWQQVLELGYVGTFGRHLLNQRQFNVIKPGTLTQGTVGNSNLADPVQRVALNGDVINTFRPYPALSNIQWWEYTGTSNYHSLQATLSRQTGRRFQYFVAYTFSKGLGSVSNEYEGVDPFDPRNFSYGVLSYDRTHLLSVSYNYQVPDITKRGGVLAGILNGWQISGITSYSSGIPIRVRFEGALAQDNISTAWNGSPDRNAAVGAGSGGPITPLFSCNPFIAGAKDVGDKIFDINCIGIPQFGQSGPYNSPLYFRSPNRQNWDITLFKNFAIGKGEKKIQFRAGFFDIFNQAYAGVPAGDARSGQDIDLHLNTVCNVTVNGVPNGAGATVDNICDPTKGFHYSDNALANFGKIILKRGHRVIEFALKLYF